MTIPTKQLANGFGMPVFGLGTWQMGGKETRDENNNDARDVSAIRFAIDAGITHIDTAERYAEGRAEELVGEAVKSYNRANLFLVSKAGAGHLNYADIKLACKNSLARLQTSYLDLYLLHRYPPQGKLEECLRAMNELVDEGLIKNIGISNFNLEHTRQAQSLSRYPIVATQVHYNLLSREPEVSGLLEYCQKNDILLIAWRPVAKGTLTEPGIPVVDELCKKYGKTPAQVALNWLMSQQNVVTLAKTSTQEHLQENLGAVGWQIDGHDLERLRKEFPNQEMVSSTIPLA